MVLTLAEELKRRNHTVVVISIDSPQAKAFYDWPSGVTWEKIVLGDPQVKASFMIRIKRVIAIRRIFRNYRIDSAVGFQIGAFALVKVASLGLGIHTVAAERNAPTLFAFIQRGRMLRRIANTLLLFSGCIAVQMESYRLLYPRILRRKIIHTPNPIIQVDNHRKSGVYASTEFSILYVGRLTFQKNLSVLIRAISSTGLNAKLTIVGDGDAKSNLQQLANEKNVRVTFLDPTKNLSAHYLSADIFCIPSRWEGFPNVVGEALAHGLPVVAFEGCAGMSDLIVNGVNGFLAEGNDNSESLGEAIRLAASATLIPGLSVASSTAFSLERFVSQWEIALTPRQRVVTN
jgi:glycosyltransferase involved in cell wall biosynthesis